MVFTVRQAEILIQNTVPYNRSSALSMSVIQLALTVSISNLIRPFPILTYHQGNPSGGCSWFSWICWNTRRFSNISRIPHHLIPPVYLFIWLLVACWSVWQFVFDIINKVLVTTCTLMAELTSRGNTNFAQQSTVFIMSDLGSCCSNLYMYM